MNYRLSEILDVEQVSELLKSYTDATGLVSALLDLDGNILSQSGWQRICTDFHRVNPDTAKNCRTSDTVLANKLVEGGEFNVYKCLNGLVDVAVPLKVNELHIGNLFTGQFLLEQPDIARFEKQAEQYNFDKQKYLESLQDVPILKIEEIRSKLNFLLQMTKVITELGLAKIKQLEANVALESSELKFRSLFENLNEGFALHEIITDDQGKPMDYRYLETNPGFKRLTGIKEDVIGKTIKELFPDIENDPANWICKFGDVALSGNDISFEDYSEGINKWVYVHAFSPKKGQFAVTFTDITDRKKAEKLLIESDEYHKALFTQTNIGLALTTLDGQLVDINKAFADIIGYSIEDILKLSYWEITPKKYEKKEQVQLQKLNTVGSYGPYEKEYIHKDGRLIPVRLQGKIIEQKGVKYIWSSVENITKNVEAQRELKYSEKKYRALVEQSVTGIYIFSKDKFIYVNKRFCEIFGYSEQEILDNLKPTDVVERQEREKAQKNINDRLSGKVKSTHYFAKGKRKDNKELWIEIHGTHIELNGEQVITGTVLDVTEGYKSSLNIERSEQKFRSLFEQASVGVAIIETATGNYQSVNKKQCDIIGYTEEEVLQLDFMKITHHDDLDEDLANMDRLKSGEIDSYMMEKRYFHKNGSIVWVNLNVSRIWLPGEEPLLHVALCEDITEKKKTVEMLAISELRYRSLFENMNAGFVLFEVIQNTKGDPIDLLIVTANFGFEKTTGLNLKEAAGKQLTKVLPGIEKDEADWIGRYSKVALTGESIQFEQGSELLGYYYSVSAFQAGPKQCAVTFLDITERKNHEKALKDEKDRIRTILDLVGDPIFVKDDQHRITMANQAFYEMFATDEKSVLGKTLAESVPEKEKKHFLQVDRNVLDTGIQDLREEELTIKNETKTIITKKIRFTDDSGNNFLVGSIHDITERKMAEENLRLSEKRYRSVSAVSNTGAWEFHQKEKYLWCSPEYFEMLGRKPEDYSMKGKSNLKERWLHLIHPDDRQAAADHFANYLDGGSVGMYENFFRMSHANGGWLWIWSRGQTIRNTDDSISNITVGTHIDITESKRLQKELEIMNTELEKKVEQRTTLLEASNKELEAFSYSVSHDLRAPLRHISGYVNLLNEQFKNNLSEEAHHYLDTISGATHQMGTLIDDLLQYSRTGRQKLRKTELNMNLLVKEVSKQLNTGLEERKINWDIQELPKVFGDYNLIKLVCTNLLDNAVKYTSNQKTAKISVSYTQEAKDFIFCVSDNGVGFDMKYAHKLFGVFQRLHSQAEFEGTGIGLANVQRIIHKHLGQVWVDAEAGKGANFYFSLPIYKEEIS